MRTIRIQTGLRFLLISLTLAILSASIPVIAGATLTALPVVGSLWVHTVLLPGTVLVLTFACGLSGVAGITSLESNRSRPSTRWRGWDRARLAAVLASLAAAFLLASGIILGMVYIPDHWILTASRIAAVVAVASGIGLYLLWTAERMHGSRALSRVALVLGIVSAGLAASTLGAVLLGASFADPVAGILLALSVSATGILSLVAWIVVYAGILGRFRSIAGPSPVPGGA